MKNTGIILETIGRIKAKRIYDSKIKCYLYSVDI